MKNARELMVSPSRLGLCAALLLAVPSGCAMPAAVSSLSQVRASSEQGQIVLVPVTPQTLPPPPQPVAAAFPAQFTSAGDFDYAELGPGDRVSIHIWESGTPTVFSATGGGSDLGEVTVDENGRLYIPYAGAIRAAGLTIPQVRSAIVGRLRTVVLDPQVDVRAVERRSALVSVQGDAAKTGSFPIAQGRTKLGELLAEVAPSQKIPEMLKVTLRRNGQAAAVRLSDIYANPALDVALRPGDSVILNEEVDNVTVLGAAGVQGQIRIPERDFDLVSAIGAAKGLSPQDADPRAVFVLRPQVDPAAPPIVYQFDMRRPESIALASRFIVQDEDAILISSAPFSQTRQVLTAFAQGLAGVRSAALVTQ